MRVVILGAAALLCCLGGSLGILHAADPRAVTIAVLRGDGLLIPFATRSGTRWINTWPEPAKSADVPLELDDIPKRWWGKPGPTTRWRAWQIDGTTSDVTVERPSWYLAHCLQGVGLQTPLTARPPLPPPKVQPYPKLGLASTAPLDFRRIEPVDQNDPIWIKVAAQVDAAMDAGERRMNGMPAINEPPRPMHPIAPAERAKVATRVESLYRLQLEGGRFLYYVEATKRYGVPSMRADEAVKVPSPQRGCAVMTFGNGFFLVEADGEVPKPNLRTVLSSCDYDAVSLMLPLAGLVEGHQHVWIGQVTGWDYESYVGFRWDAERGTATELFGARGGWCVDDDSW